jgi:hypothetical protein
VIPILVILVLVFCVVAGGTDIKEAAAAQVNP